MFRIHVVWISCSAFTTSIDTSATEHRTGWILMRFFPRPVLFDININVEVNPHGWIVVVAFIQLRQHPKSSVTHETSRHAEFQYIPPRRNLAPYLYISKRPWSRKIYRIISWKTENSFPPFQNRELKISLPFVFYLETQIRFDFNLRIFLNFALFNIIAFRLINFEILPKNFQARFINGKRLDK